HQENWEPMLLSDLLKGLGYPLVSEVRMPLFLQRRKNSNGSFRAELLVSVKELMESQPTGWLCKQENNTSKGKKQRPISVPHKPCWQIWQPCMPYITAPMG